MNHLARRDFLRFLAASPLLAGLGSLEAFADGGEPLAEVPIPPAVHRHLHVVAAPDELPRHRRHGLGRAGPRRRREQLEHPHRTSS